MYEFFSGMTAMGSFVVALFFARFWVRTRESLFAVFGAAFLLMAVNQSLLALIDIPREEQSWIYLLRLAAFTLIILAIIRKNLVLR